MDTTPPLPDATPADATPTADPIPTPAARTPRDGPRKSRRPRIPRREWLLGAGLALLAAIPSIAGAVKLEGLATGVPATPETARFVEMPTPVAIHIVAAIVYSYVGIGQFLPTVRRRNLGLHRAMGRYVLVPAGFAVALTGLWMNVAYEFPAIDGVGLLISRYVVGIGMAVALVLALVAIGRRDVPTHAAWMIRAYALALGAGTQVLTSAPPMILFGPPDELGRLLQMDAGWLINIVVAELVIARWIRPRRRPSTTSGHRTKTSRRAGTARPKAAQA
ncbi:DUF2306 domain-containing protein [Brachybacterium sp. GCM10030268]|uniref:DUF2306 domain-containing protein n=1 Tax=Brachybacterium sp. GCM10030268 TaxID=3273382 RepID=UPI003615E407